MRLILSRKGFDSSAGGCPSPILPDGRLCSLPIPDKQSPWRYCDITVNGENAGKLVTDLTGEAKRAGHFAHIDPDVDRRALPRDANWRGLLGQDSTAQAHLRNQGVTVGDLFLFFGLFRPVEDADGRWQFIKAEPARHIIWGWLQVGAVYSVSKLAPAALPWARYHPHFSGERGPLNTLYEASQELSLPNGNRPEVSGYGIFNHYQPARQLSAQESRKPSQWRLPQAFYPPSMEAALTYHQKPERWQLEENHCRLNSAARGQEFVLDTEKYPEIHPWLASLFTNE
ncbi:hypothetical protein PVT68_10480 [Microbulbifer bruguierae]|uniref:Nucleotide modification associated domain-containing protein n=1 Tax=Microbulbifer bruguierae TaxID=3029061 RepID=A0ABY8N9N5_9GAMM|nr:hypothetical protein [Microbulbifer bruguierae]WGL15200.1 hypothetical protein PVT68_10480 [Microbulbifer bruguierae]